MTYAAIPLVIVLGLAGGCSTVRDITGQEDYVVTSATPASITIEFEEAELAKAQGRADAHCRQYSRTARMQTVSPADGDSVAVFNCV
jgi:hypothetical protein